VENDRYDAILFTQVMEHLPEPDRVVRELNRVLKPGGLLLYTGPLFYEEHEIPFDFHRYTQFAVRRIFNEAGFTVRDLRWLEGYMGTLHYQLKRMSRHMPLSPQKIGGGPAAWLLTTLFMFLKPTLRLAASLAGRCDVRRRYSETGFPINYVALMEKTRNAI
jgi:SAM-dependent methyltransferase